METSLIRNEKGMVYPYGVDAFGRILCSSSRGGPPGLCGAVSNAESGSKRPVWTRFSGGGSEHAETFGRSN
jgi:hypothetical protein